MASVKPFAAIRPKSEYAKSVIAPPYDVLSREEAENLAKDRPLSFLHVTRAEIDLPRNIDPYNPEVYLKARENLKAYLDRGIFIREKKCCYYIYQLGFGGRTQTGLVAAFSIDDYQNNIIKKHELTLPEKENDRTEHFNVCSAHTEPVFLTYERDEKVQKIIHNWTKEHEAVYDFNSDDEVKHCFWTVDDPDVIAALETAFSGISRLYIADGHHRTASSVRVGLNRREAAGTYTGSEEFNFFPGVIFPCDELKIYDYNRLVSDLNGLTPDEFMLRLSSDFFITEIGKEGLAPDVPREFSMYLEGKWYSLKLRERGFCPVNPVNGLDVSILQNLVLDPVLGIKDPRTDSRIEFSGGIRGLADLKKRVDAGMAAAFALYPPSMDDLMRIAQKGLTMPPKSTWFEPKLGSGLFVHEF